MLHELNQHKISSMNKNRFKKRKINVQVIEEKNEHAKCFTNKYQHVTGSKNNNQHPTSSMSKISFTRRKNQCTSFTERNIDMQQVSPRKIRSQQVPWKKSISRAEKINVQDSAREISTCNRFYGKKSARTMFQEQNKSALTDLHEQNYFHKEKNQCTSFTKRKIIMQQVSTTKISMK